MLRWALIAAAVSGLLAVALGAFAAHALQQQLGTGGRDILDTASRYHFLHTLALAAGAFAPALGAGRRACQYACALWLGGMVLFSGSLYLLAVTQVGWLGAITPFGGIALMLGWFFLMIAAWRGPEVAP